jgi:ferredoxin
MKANRPGSSRLDFAFSTAAWTVASTLGTMSGSIDGAHRGLYSLAPLPGSFMSTFPLLQMEPWKPEHLSPQDISVILKNARTYEALTSSNNPGVYKWPVDAEKCQRVWCHAGHDCAVCIRVCPFNRPASWVHRATQTLISAGVEDVDQFLIKVDTLSEEGKRASPEEFWEPEQRRPAHKRARTRRITRQLSREAKERSSHRWSPCEGLRERRCI